MRSRLLFLVPLVAALLAGFVIAPTAAQAAGKSYLWVGNSVPNGGDNASWGDPLNWQPNGVPGNGDSVSIAAPDSLHCATHVVGAPDVTLANFTMYTDPAVACSVSLSGTGLHVTGMLFWDGGQLDIPTTIASGASGTISGSYQELNHLTQDLTVAGTLLLSNASGDGGLKIDDPLRLTVKPGATLHASGTNLITYSACCVNPARVVNNGTLQVTGGNLTVEAVEVDQNGVLSTSGGNRLVSTIAPDTMGDGASYTGNGGWTIQDTATLVASGTQTVGKDFDVEFGGLHVNSGSRFGGTATFTGSGTLNWTGGTIEGNYTFAHGFSVDVAGAHTDNGARLLWGSDGLSGGKRASVVNHGTFTVTNGAGFSTQYSARFVNAANGAVVFAPGTEISSYGCCTDPDRITNQGTLTVPVGANTKPVVITNVAYWSPGGTTNIAAGRSLQLLGGATGKFQGATVTGGGTLGLGEPSADAGTTTIGPKTTVVLQKPYGTVDGTARFAGPGSFVWTGGSISGDVTLATKGGVTVRGANGKTLANVGGGYTTSKLTIPVRTTIAAGTAKKPNPVDLGSSTLTLAGPSTIGNHVQFYAGKLINTGKLVLNPGKRGEIDHNGSGTFINRGSTTLRSGTFSLYGNYVQAAGTTTLAAGSRLARQYSSYPITVTGGTLAGAGRIDAALVNKHGTIRPGGAGVGQLRVSGTFTQGRAGTLAIDHTAKRSDAIVAAGTASLNGHLVSHNVGRFHPRIGMTRKVVGAPSVSGNFRCTTSSGSAASGRRAGHWAPARARHGINVVWRKGAQTRC